MNELLKQAIAEAQKLSLEQQEEFARWMLAELANMQQWKESAEAAADSLEWMADESAEEHTSG